MTDRELLEAAARAAGIEPIHGVYWRNYKASTQWNPLADDGDALRLAVKLNLDVTTSLTHMGKVWADAWDEGLEEYRSVNEPRCSDPYAATRRAIVRAAAAVAEVPHATQDQP